MTKKFMKTKPSFLEAGLPCSSLSAECQRDNNARQRPPQNRLHIWWARRPPTISRAAILSALLPHDHRPDKKLLPTVGAEPDELLLDELPKTFEEYRFFFEDLLREALFTDLSPSHAALLRVLGVLGDSDAAYRRIAAAKDFIVGNKPIQLPEGWGYVHTPAFFTTPSAPLIKSLLDDMRGYLDLPQYEQVTVLDCTAGGGTIPAEAVRYGCKVYANDLNPVASLVLKATIEYTAKYGRGLCPVLKVQAEGIAQAVQDRVSAYFYHQGPDEWWSEEVDEARRKFKGKDIVKREPAGQEKIAAALWLRTIPCPKCSLNIPLSTNLHIRKKKGKPADDLAAFPEVPPIGQGNDCTFRIVKKSQYKDCTWPRLRGEPWHPSIHTSYRGGDAKCPRCDETIPSDEVKEYARSREGGLPAQIYAVASQVPVKLTYRQKRGEAESKVKIRYLWRFRAPVKADLDAVKAAEAEVDKLMARWGSDVPFEAIPPGDKTREPRNMGLMRFQDLFLPRQLLVNMTVMEEIRSAIARVRQELPEDQAEAVAVYLSVILGKIISYNSVQCSWHDSRTQLRGTFMGHDFRYHAGFAEMEGAREIIMWGANQVIDAYEDIARLIHGETIDTNKATGDDEGGGEDEENEQEEIEVAEDESEEEDGEDAEERPVAIEGTEDVHLRQEVIVPTVTNDDAAALSEPAPGSVHLICMDPPYYNNVQYSELSDFFYVWHKRTLRDVPSLANLFQSEYADFSREAVANSARWKEQADRDEEEWKKAVETRVEELRSQGVKAAQARKQAKEELPKPLTAQERADQFYEAKMKAIFRRCLTLLHPAGRMVVMFNHKMTAAWRALGKALIEAGFEIRSSIPVHTEAESSLNIRGLDAARSTVLLLCMPREEKEQPPGNLGVVKTKVRQVARRAAEHFSKQGLSGTDLFLSSLGPALRQVGENWPVTDLAGRSIDIENVLEEAYGAVGLWRLDEILHELTERGQKYAAIENFNAQEVDSSTQTLWLWLDVFQGDLAASDDVRRLAKALGFDPSSFEKLGLLAKEKGNFKLLPPQQTDLRALSRRLRGERVATRRELGEEDWEQRTFPNFLGAAVWNAIGLKIGAPGDSSQRGVGLVERWCRASGYASQKDFIGAFAVTLHLLEKTFGNRKKDDDPWRIVVEEARNTWNLAIKDLME